MPDTTLLTLAFTKNNKEYALFQRHLNILHKHKNIMRYVVVHFRGCKATIHDSMSDTSANHLIHRDDDDMDQWLHRVVNAIQQPRHFDCVHYYGHAMGWRTSKHLSVPVFIQEVLAKYRPRYTCLDTCYMADIRVFEAIHPYTRYVIASPSYHPYTSVLDTTSFFRMPTSKSSHAQWVKYLNRLVEEFTSKHIARKEPQYSCLFGFDLQSLKAFFSDVQHVHHLLCDPKQHMPHDKKRFDYVNCLKSVNLQKQLLKSIVTPHACRFLTHGIGVQTR